MSSPIEKAKTEARPFRVRRQENRVLFWADKLKSAGSGDEALADMWRWLRAVLAAVEAQRPQVAEAARWEIARGLALIIVRLPLAKYSLRAGLTEAEERALLDPWGRNGGDAQ